MTLVATLIANPADKLLAADLAEATAGQLGAHGVDWLAQGIACDITLPQDSNREQAATTLSHLLAGKQVDHAVQQMQFRRKKALIADMDSTMIGQECIDELAAEAGFGNEVAAITARAMNGEIDFEPALRERVALLKGLPLSVIDLVLKTRITLTPGARELIATTKAQGGHTLLVSGGFTRFTGPVSEMAGFDQHRANVLDDDGNVLLGTVREPILGRQAKIETLQSVAAEKGLSPHDFIAVGDGANDLGMLSLAGAGVALHAKPVVAEQADIRIDHGDLTALLYLQGYRQNEFVS